MSSSISILGIDLGGTKTALTLYNSDFQIIDSFVIATGASRGYNAVMQSLLIETQKIIRPDTQAIGLGVPGFIEHRSGTVKSMPNIPDAEGKQPAEFLTQQTGIPVTIENDARCFTYAEALLGAGKGSFIVLGITIGTGVGGGIVMNGNIFRGARGLAGEVGHSLLQPGLPPYPTDDKRGDAEQFLSGTAMGKRCEAASSPEEYLEGAVCGFMQPQIFKEVAWLIVNVVHTIDPTVIVLGGSAGRALKPHLSAIRTELTQWLLPQVSPPKIICGALEDAPTRGAALLASTQIFS